jgi:hypothetical protein
MKIIICILCLHVNVYTILFQTIKICGFGYVIICMTTSPNLAVDQGLPESFISKWLMMFV